MTGEIICVGTELLLGDIVNTNAQFLSKELASLGINIYNQTTVGDNEARLRSAISEAVSRSDIIFLTGGLGPTKDDLTKETVAVMFGIPLIEDAEAMRRIEEYFARSGRVMTENNRKQALVPEGATVFQNNHGTAPGLAIASKSQVIILLPGPPAELQPMFEESVKGYLADFCNTTIVSHSIRLFGIGESSAADRLADLFDSSNPTVAPYAKTGEVEIRVTAMADTQQAADAMIQPTVDEISRRLGDYIYGIDVDSLQHKLIEELKTAGKKIATAESCTAGLLSKKLTEVPGSSTVFDMGIVAYANNVKINALGVPAEMIQQYGAVSPQTAAGMAVGVREISGADIGVSITGIAGPDGSENKPVGLVYIALCDGVSVWVERLLIGNGSGGERETIREISAKSVLSLACRYLKNSALLNNRAALSDIYNDGVFSSLMWTAAGAGTSAELHAEQPQAAPVAGVSVPEEPIPVVSEDPADIQEEKSAENLLDYSSNRRRKGGRNTKSGKKKPWYRRLREYLFPCKGDKPGEVVRKLVFLVAVILLIGSGTYVTHYFLNGFSSRGDIAAVRENYDATDDTVDEEGVYNKFDSLLAMNSDTIGWLTIDGTNVDNPVFHNTSIGSTAQEKNDYYVHYNMFREKNAYGALFLDAAASFSKDSVSQNSVIYGHNMNDGSMFNNLRQYRDADFLLQHMTISFDTLYRTGEYKVFAVFVTNTVASDDNGYIFNYRMSDFEDQDQFLTWIENCQVRSIYNCPVDIQEDDEILTLSTCIYDFSNARLVVMARRVRDGESSDVDVSQVSVNSSPLYPQAWYDKKGGSKPYSGYRLQAFNTTADIPGSSTAGTTASKKTTTSAAKTSSKTVAASSAVSSESSASSSASASSDVSGTSSAD